MEDLFCEEFWDSAFFPNCTKYPKLVCPNHTLPNVLGWSPQLYSEKFSYLYYSSIVTELFWNTFLVKWSPCLWGAKPTLVRVSDLQPHYCLTVMDVSVVFKLFSFRLVAKLCTDTETIILNFRKGYLFTRWRYKPIRCESSIINA